MTRKLLFIVCVTWSCSTPIDQTRGLWFGGVVGYCYASDLTSAEKTMIQEAMMSWENGTNIEFVKDNCGKGVYHIYRDRSVHSSGSTFGFSYENSNKVILGNNISLKVVAHELGHCLGLWHEFQRPDRDDYVKIIFDNILRDEWHNFSIIDNPFYVEQDFPYQYDSVMGYDLSAFTNDNGSNMESLDGTPIDPSNTPTDIDKEKINLMYGG